MKTFLKQDVADAITGVCEKLGITLDVSLQQEYQNGQHPKLLSYEKLDKSALEIPAIQKYLIGVQTFLNQPCQFYEINKSCRHVIFIQILNNALETIIEEMQGFEARLERLKQEIRYDSFEAVLYEVVVAANYSKRDEVKSVEFVEEQGIESPDLHVVTSIGEMFVECKKFDRSADIAFKLRDVVRDKVALTMDTFRSKGQAAILELSFHVDPSSISETLIRDVSLQSLESGTPILEKTITVYVKPLLERKLDEFILFPSPKFYWERYQYKDKGKWFGIVNIIEAMYADHVDVAGLDGFRASTWLDDIGYECAVKWNITDEDVIWRYKRLGYTRLFKGLSQIQSRSSNSILHVWYERDGSIGHRQKELLDFYGRLVSKDEEKFAWIIFNETSLDCSVAGYFDLIEHSHPIGGKGRKSNQLLVSSVFTSDDIEPLNNGEFGIGHELPDIDK